MKNFIFSRVNLRSYEAEDVERVPISDQLHKDSLAFRMLRMHGHDVSPGKNQQLFRLGVEIILSKGMLVFSVPSLKVFV